MTYGMDPVRYYLSLAGVNIISNITIALFFSAVLTPRRSKKFSTLIIFLYFLISGLCFMPIREKTTVKSVIYVFTVWIPLFLMYKNKTFEIVTAVVLNTISQSLCEAVVVLYYIIISVSPTSDEVATNFKVSLMIAAPALIIFECISVYIWRNIFAKKNMQSYNISTIMLGASQILTMCTLTILNFEFSIFSVSILITFIISCTLSIASFMLIIFSMKQAAISERDITIYENYIEAFKQRDKAMQDQYLEMRRIKHDINKHMNTLKYLKDDSEELHKYILKLDEFIDEKHTARIEQSLSYKSEEIS